MLEGRDKGIISHKAPYAFLDTQWGGSDVGTSELVPFDEIVEDEYIQRSRTQEPVKTKGLPEGLHQRKRTLATPTT